MIKFKNKISDIACNRCDYWDKEASWCRYDAEGSYTYYDRDAAAMHDACSDFAGDASVIWKLLNPYIPRYND